MKIVSLRLAVFAATATLQGCTAIAPPQPVDIDRCPAFIGAARLGEGGELLLMLRAETEDGAVGHALIVIPRSDPRYGQHIQHIGGLRQGEEKLVPSWGCKADRASTQPVK
ncbi:hypothetical protein [Pelomonas sp. Root1444]|uniref:hypothetical protein n=1 Tax=Pelomonas sp. Root1444 TaxID=1736464 RepID=UPI0012F77C72|nr:hypothetical protein [Pelomonas sp. Root1444]